MPSDEKVTLFMNKVSVNEKRFKHFKLMLYGVTKKQKRVSRLETVVKSYEDRIRLLENNSIDLEARSRRNNILFYGSAEYRNENCTDIIHQFIADQFDIVVEQNDLKERLIYKQNYKQLLFLSL